MPLARRLRQRFVRPAIRPRPAARRLAVEPPEARENPSAGALDPTFVSGGVVVTGNVGTASLSEARKVALQPDGKIVAAGCVEGYWAGPSWAVARYNSNGTRDAGFGAGGLVINGEGAIEAAALGADGNIVAVGIEPSISGLGGSHFAAGRYLTSATTIGGVTYPAGSPDPTFGSNGVATTTVVGNPVSPEPHHTRAIPPGVAIQPDGRIVQVGTAGPPGSFTAGATQYPAAVLRYLPSAPQVGSFAAAPNPVTAGNSVTLTAGSIADGNAGAAVTQVAFGG
jgi:uncharacterized delta-60 repeat protein